MFIIGLGNLNDDELIFDDALDISGPPGYGSPRCLATLSKTSPAESSRVLPKIL